MYKKIFLISIIFSNNAFSLEENIQKGTSNNIDETSTPALNISVKTSPKEGNGLAKGVLINVNQKDGNAHNIDALRSEIVSSGEILDSINGVHGVANTKNGQPKPGAAFTGIWGESYAPKNAKPNIPYVSIGAEFNVYQTKVRNSSNSYLNDPLATGKSDHGGTIGVLINNYQGTSQVGHPAYDLNNIGNGNYWNDFGLAITSQSKNGRALGYQTGIYVSEVANELIHLRSGVFGNSQQQSDYGIFFSGPSMAKAGIALGNNKINLGGYSGELKNAGDFFYNSFSGQIWFKDLYGNKNILKSEPSSKSGQILVSYENQQKWSNAITVESISIKKNNNSNQTENNIFIEGNAGKFTLKNKTYNPKKPFCFNLINKAINKDDVFVLNLSNNNHPDSYISQVANIENGKAIICIHSKMTTEDELIINFVKIGVK